MWLDSGWWVTLRNQFARAPDVALQILQSVADDLSRLTGAATTARGVDAEEVTLRVFSTTVEAEGPAYWALTTGSGMTGPQGSAAEVVASAGRV